MITHTHHAAVRAQQRAIPPFVEFVLDESGDRLYDGRGGILSFFSRRSIRRMERCWGRRPVAKMSEYLSVYRVEDSRNGTVITVGHRSKRMKRS